MAKEPWCVAPWFGGRKTVWELSLSANNVRRIYWSPNLKYAACSSGPDFKPCVRKSSGDEFEIPANEFLSHPGTLPPAFQVLNDGSVMSFSMGRQTSCRVRLDGQLVADIPSPRSFVWLKPGNWAVLTDKGEIMDDHGLIFCLSQVSKRDELVAHGGRLFISQNGKLRSVTWSDELSEVFVDSVAEDASGTKVCYVGARSEKCVGFWVNDQLVDAWQNLPIKKCSPCGFLKDGTAYVPVLLQTKKGKIWFCFFGDGSRRELKFGGDIKVTGVIGRTKNGPLTFIIKHLTDDNPSLRLVTVFPGEDVRNVPGEFSSISDAQVVEDGDGFDEFLFVGTRFGTCQEAVYSISAKDKSLLPLTPMSESLTRLRVMPGTSNQQRHVAVCLSSTSYHTRVTTISSLLLDGFAGPAHDSIQDVYFDEQTRAVRYVSVGLICDDSGALIKYTCHEVSLTS